MAVLLENFFKLRMLCIPLSLYFIFLIYLNPLVNADNGRVMIDGSGSKYVIEGCNLTLVCRYDHLTPPLIWYNLEKVMVPTIGSIHITTSTLLHYNSTMSTLELINVTKDGTFKCMSGDMSFEVDVIVLNVFLNESISLKQPTYHNLSCELTGFSHNFPEIKVFWILPSNLSIDKPMNGFVVGVSKQKHLTWLFIDAQKNPGKYYCIFELPSLDGSFMANGSFLLVGTERIEGDDTHSSSYTVHRARILLVLITIIIIITSISNSCDDERKTKSTEILDDWV